MAKLKAILESLEGMADPIKELYEKTEDGYVLTGIEDAGYKTKLDEFRTNNRKLHKERESLNEKLTKFKDVDPEKYAEAVKALEKLDALADSALIKDGKLEEVLQKRTENMRADFDAKVKAKDTALKLAQEERNKLSTRLGAIVIDSTVQTNINKVGKVRTGAMGDILNRARNVFQIDTEGHATPKDAKGDTVYDTDGNPMTMETWAKTLVEEAPWLFEGGGGSGGKGGSGGPGAGVKTLDGNDPVSFGKNLEDIAKGKVTVTN